MMILLGTLQIGNARPPIVRHNFDALAKGVGNFFLDHFIIDTAADHKVCRQFLYRNVQLSEGPISGAFKLQIP